MLSDTGCFLVLAKTFSKVNLSVSQCRRTAVLAVAFSTRPAAALLSVSQHFIPTGFGFSFLLTVGSNGELE